MLNIWASQQQGGRVRPAPFATADFKNGVYTFNGAPAIYADIIRGPRYHVSYTAPHIVPGVGWINNGADQAISVTDDLLALLDIAGTGFSIIVSQYMDSGEAGGAAARLDVGDAPNWLYGWEAIASNYYNDPANSFFQLTDFFGYDDKLSYTPTDVQRWGASFSNGLISHATAGDLLGSTVPHTDSLVPAGPTFIDISNFGESGSKALIERIDFYPLLTNAQMVLLT